MSYTGPVKFTISISQPLQDPASTSRIWRDLPRICAISSFNLSAETPGAQSVSLQEIGRILLHYARSQPQPPRLALVLSGGGAKCSYQVGAVAALEQELATLRRENHEEKLDISLVVGTSGGAMNALPIALGISSTPQGQENLKKIWTELDQREMVRPSELVRGNMGLWFACMQIAVILWGVRRWVTEPQKRPVRVAICLILLAILQIAVGHTGRTPWHWLGPNHLLHHLWLWATFGIRWSAWCLLGLGLLILLIQNRMAGHGNYLQIRSRLVLWLLAAGLLGLPLLQAPTLLFHEATLSDGSGIQHVLAQKYPWMINQKLAREGVPPLVLDPSLNDTDLLPAISRQIFERHLLRRDLVFTGSCLSQTTSDLPSDLYFYAASDSQRSGPRYGTRGVSLPDQSSLLLDVVMGSGSIYPIFPARPLKNFPHPGQQVELVDGGFAHNSPTEAAILWGATHMVLIQASPEERSQRGNLLQNFGDAFNHLYNQAQLLDAHSKERVVVFTLAPEAPHLCVIDFADTLIRASIEKGYREAMGEVRHGKTLLTGQPQFSQGTR